MKHSKFTLQYLIFAILFAGTALLIGKTAILETTALLEPDAIPTASEEITRSPRLIIDPGHGGEDGGASVGDTLEKNLNLQVSLCLSDLCALFGYEAGLTRQEDTLLYDHYGDLADYTGHKKTYDLKNRLRMAEESGAELYVGIHMNKFPQTQYKGLQVYYAPGAAGSERAANLVQSYAKQYLSGENNREIKRADNNIYILHRITIPAVLVECGFLSNPEERELLQTPSYQSRLSAALFSAAAEYLTSP